MTDLGDVLVAFLPFLVVVIVLGGIGWRSKREQQRKEHRGP